MKNSSNSAAILQIQNCVSISVLAPTIKYTVQKKTHSSLQKYFLDSVQFASDQ